MSAADLALIGVDPTTVLHAFAWGFAAVYGCWGAGFGVRVALQVIRKL